MDELKIKKNPLKEDELFRNTKYSNINKESMQSSWHNFVKPTKFTVK